MPESSALEVKNLTVHFSRTFGFLGRLGRTTKAVEDVSFEMGELDVVCLVGESGSGKTTLGRCIAALTHPTSGEILYRGVNVAKLRGGALRNYRKEVQMVFQDPFASLNPRQNIYAILSTPLRKLTGLTGPAKLYEESVSLLTDVGLQEDVIHKLPHQLSGGERQRVSIARALASRPKVLIADEPVSMLDASLRLNFLALFSRLRTERNMSILLITHDLATAKVMGGRTAVMYLGKLVEIGPTSEILARPHHPYAELLLESTPRMKGEPTVGEGTTIEKSERVTKGCVYRPRCKYATSICAETEPPLEEKTHSHLVACHNWLNRPEPKAVTVS
ncbi:MAG: ABC transporter ATP-binding protein [Thaumarchaeota archaeon]|nr:ABC transporter ATP-binding protein [Nitrososphaerota archaeon]